MANNNIPEKLDYIMETKELLKEKIESTGQNSDVPFIQYKDLIANIPNTGAITYDEIDRLTRLAIEISGEKA